VRALVLVFLLVPLLSHSMSEEHQKKRKLLRCHYWMWLPEYKLFGCSG
jgi:hypothetical protein